MKIAYCTHTDPMDKRSWSGTHYYMKKALERRGVKIRAFGPLKNRYLSIYRRYRKLLERLFNKRISEYHMKAVCSSFAKALGHMLKEAREQFDYLFFPAGSHILSRLKTDIPCVLISDASFPGMINYYPEFTNLTKSAIKQGMETERTAIEKSGMVFYASDWALESAAKAYGDHIRKKCFVIPFGANMEIRHDRSILERRKPHQGEIRILFVASS